MMTDKKENTVTVVIIVLVSFFFMLSIVVMMGYLWKTGKKCFKESSRLQEGIVIKCLTSLSLSLIFQT